MIHKLKTPTLIVAVVLAASALAASGSQASNFITEEGNYPVSISGFQAGQHVLAVETESNMTSSKLECPVGILNGTAASPSAVVKMHPEYKGEAGKSCLAFGQKATITTTGCDIGVEVGAEKAVGEYNAPIDIVCESGTVIVIATLTCEVRIGPQEGLGPATFISNPAKVTGEEVVDPKTVNLNAAVTGIKYTIAKDGVGCPLRQTGGTALPTTNADATVTGNTLIKAYIGETQQNATIN